MNCYDGNYFRDYQLTNIPMQLFHEHGWTEKEYNECLAVAALFYQNDRNFISIGSLQRRNIYA